MVEAGTGAGIPLAAGILAVAIISEAFTFLAGMWADFMEGVSVTLTAAISAAAHTSWIITPRHTDGRTLPPPRSSHTALSIITTSITILSIIMSSIITG